MIPSLHLLHGDVGVRADLEHDLRRRFGADYDIRSHAGADAALTALRRDADEGRRVAIVFSDESPAGGSAELLAVVHELHPLARRVLLIGRGEWSKEHPAVAAMRTGQVDSYIFVPWGLRERWLYLSVSEILADWEASQPTPFEAARIIGEAYEARAHSLRDVFSRIGVPFRFIAAGSEEGRALRAELGAEDARLPLVAFRTRDGALRPVARAGRQGARVRDRARSRRLRRRHRRRRPGRPGGGGLCGLRGPADDGDRAVRTRVGRRGRAPGSATTSASRTGSPAATWPTGRSSRRGSSAPASCSPGAPSRSSPRPESMSSGSRAGRRCGRVPS